jgi:hypothetical protein
VGIPALKLQEKVEKLEEEGVEVASDPEFLRLHMRRPGFRAIVPLRPVLKAASQDGVSDDWLTVPASFNKSIPSEPPAVEVTSASEKAFHWYRFRHSLGTLFGTVLAIISGTLLALGTAGFTWSRKALIAGVVLAILAVVAAAVSTWRTLAD